MTTVAITETDFRPNLLEVKEPRNMNAKNGTGFRRADIKYNGGNFMPEFPITKTSGVFWTKEKIDEKTGNVSPPKPMLRKDLDPKEPSDAAIMRYYDKIYCDIFAKLSAYCRSFNRSSMLMYSKITFEQLEQPDPMKPGMTYRESMSELLKNFYGYPNFADGPNKGQPDKSKSLMMMIELRRSNTTQKETGGMDNYDCQFRDIQDKPILWGDLTGELVVKLKTGIPNVYVPLGGNANPSIQEKLVSGDVISRTSSGGMAGGYIKSDKPVVDTLTPEQKQLALEFAEFMAMKAKTQTQVKMPPEKGEEREVQHDPLVREVKEEIKKKEEVKMKEVPPVDTTPNFGALNTGINVDVAKTLGISMEDMMKAMAMMNK